jgi:hypothetical protein
LTKLGPEIAWNIENETALALDDFVNLLTTFAVELAKPVATVDAWITACRNHTFKGRQVQTPNLPVILGRVKSFPDHKDAIFKAAGGSIRPLNIEKALKKYADTINADELPNGFKRALYGAYLGEYTIWATFNFADSTQRPFTHFPTTHSGICAALGLGHIKNSDAIILLTVNHANSGAPALHRPTIAEAETSIYFQAHLDPVMYCGWTKPLPHSAPPPAQPELVMRKTDCAGLQLPFHVVEP